MKARSCGGPEGRIEAEASIAMKERTPRLLGVACALAVGIAMALACAGSAPRPVEAGSGGPAPAVVTTGARSAAVGPAPSVAPAVPVPAASVATTAAVDAGAASTFVARSQRGEVVPPGLDDIEPMCALLTGCDKLPLPPSLIPADFQSCVKKITDEMASVAAVNFSLTMRECGLHSASCANLRACVLRGANADSCIGRGKQNLVGSCDVEGRAVTCWHEQILAVRDCPRGGEQCIVVDGQATCTLGSCPTSIKEGDKPRCSGGGSHLLHCEKGKLASLDCAAFGLKCSTAVDGTAGCSTAGPPCGADTKRCDGNVAVGCFNGHEVRVDCNSASLTCRPAPGATPVGACVAPAPPVTDSCNTGERARCEDGNVKYCFAGAPRSFSCRAAGFARCESGKNGARCVQ
jgi:hypothetical protein